MQGAKLLRVPRSLRRGGGVSNVDMFLVLNRSKIISSSCFSVRLVGKGMLGCCDGLGVRDIVGSCGCGRHLREMCASSIFIRHLDDNPNVVTLCGTPSDPMWLV